MSRSRTMVTRNNGKQRTGSGRVDNMDTIRWGEQAQQDAVAWHFGAKRVPRENEPAFVAALRDLLDGTEPWDVRATRARAALGQEAGS